MRRALALLITVAAGMSLQGAHAVSDGHYSPDRQHCAGSDDNSDNGASTGPDCHTAIMALLDGSGHEYVGAGLRQTPDGEFVHTLDAWVDPGQGSKYTWSVDFTFDGPPVISGPVVSTGSAADPASGYQLYFGADDNLDVGEHDSSDQINNGPSDGGGITVKLTPESVQGWIDAISANPASLLTSPLPVDDAGLGACADGLCFNAATVQRTAFDGTPFGGSGSRDVYNYVGKQWDPDSCDGGHDSAAACGGYPLSYWAGLEGHVHVEPGLQIYEDPDPQASPLGGVYPIPAFYIGTCGILFGGGADGTQFRFDGQPGANAAGQLDATIC